jgi:hypothetical protein
MTGIGIRTFVSGAALAAAAVLYVPCAFAADTPITEEARSHFAAGVALLQDPKAPRYEEAYREFKAAYAAAPSYKILGNLGLCAMKIERDGEAIHAYELYLKEAGFELASEDREQIERDLLTLKMGNAKVTISSDPPGAAIFDVRMPVQGDEVRNSYGEVLTHLTLWLRHGHHVMKAHLAGYVDQEWEFEATGAAMESHVFRMMKPAPVVVEAPAASRARPLPPAAYVTGAVTLALAATGSVLGALAVSKRNDFNSSNDGDHVGPAETARSDTQKLNTATDAFLGAAVLGAGVTLYIVLSRPTVEHPAASRLRLVPIAGAHAAGALATWAF